MAGRKDPDYIPEIVEDIRNGMDKEALMKKYYLNEKGLENEITRLRRFVDLDVRAAKPQRNHHETLYADGNEIIFDFPDEEEVGATTGSSTSLTRKLRGKEPSELEATVGRAMELKDYYGEDVDPTSPRRSGSIIQLIVVLFIATIALVVPLMYLIGPSDTGARIWSFFSEYVTGSEAPSQPTQTFRPNFRQEARPVSGGDSAHGEKHGSPQATFVGEGGGGGALPNTPPGTTDKDAPPIEDGGGGKL